MVSGYFPVVRMGQAVESTETETLIDFSLDGNFKKCGDLELLEFEARASVKIETRTSIPEEENLLSSGPEDFLGLLLSKLSTVGVRF